MKLFLTIAVLFFSLTVFSQNSGNWKQVNDNFPDKGIGVVIYSSVSPHDSNKVYILTNSLWYSTNRGESWILKYEYDPNFVFQKILFDPIDPNKIWAIINSSLYKSLDGGDNWINLNTEIKLNYTKRDQIHVDPVTAAIFIYDQYGLRKSVDDGLTWIQILTIPVAEVIMNPLNHNTLYLLPNYNVTSQIKKSTDGGNTWSDYSTPTSTYGYKDIDLTKDDTNYVYLYGGHSYGYGSQIALSTDGGQTFNLQTLNTTIFDKNEFNNFSVSQTNKNIVFVGGVECYYSTNNGNTYTQISSNIIHVDHRDLRRDNFNTIWSSNDGGIYISRDDGLTWVNKTNSLNIHICTDLASSETDSSVFLVGLNHDRIKMKKDTNWRSVLIAGDGFNVAIHPTNPQIIFGKNQYSFYKSFNGGLTSTGAFNSFSESTYGFDDSYPLVFNHQNPTTIYLLSNNVWKGNINSPNLVKISNLPTATDGGGFLYVCSVDSNVIYTKYHNTQNGGVTWTLNPRIVLNVDPDEPNKIWGYYNSSICFSSNGGSTWINLPNHEFSTNLNYKISVANNSFNGIYVYSGSNLYYIDDRLSNWQKFSVGLPKNEEIIKLNVLENFNTVRLATGYRGVWESSIYTPDTLIANVLNYSSALNINSSCVNDTVRFYDNSVSSGLGLGTVYNWSFPGANPSFSSDVNPKVVYSSSGNYPYSLTINNFLGTSTFYDTIKIGDSIPSLLLSGNNPVCSGDTLFLEANTTPNASYSWSGPFAYNSTNEDPFVAGMISFKTGNYICIVDLHGCIDKDTLNVTLKPIIPVTATNTGPYCENGTIQLNATSIASATYEWSGPNGFTSNIQNPTIDSVNSSKIGNYTLYVYIDGCKQGPYTTNVSLTTPPTPTSLSLYCTGNTIYLNPGGSFTGGTQFLWTGPNGYTSTTGISSIYNANQSMSGDYILKKDGCHILGTTTVVVNAIPSQPIVSNSGPICSGTSVQLFANSDPGVTYHWSGPSFSSTIQNPTLVLNNSGTYQVYASYLNCISALASTSVVVNPSPSANITGNSVVCSGQTLSLTTASTSGATYSWTGPNGFTSSLQSPTIPAVTSLNAGVYSLTKSIAGCSGTTANFTVTVNPTPTNPFPTNTGPYCIGNTISLNSNFVSGATYSWIGPSSFTSSMQNPTIPSASITNSGVYNVKITKSGCSSPYYNTNVIVNSIPNSPIITSNSPICEGNSINLNASTVTGATYSWNGPNGFTSSLQNPLILNSSSLNAGNYQVQSIKNGCQSTFTTTSVIVNPIPTTPTATNTGTYCEGDSIQLSCNTISGATYEWVGPNGFNSTIQNPILTNASSILTGAYSVRAKVNGCYSSYSTTNVVVNPAPSIPSASNSGPYCENDTLELFASSIAGATYEWIGPNSFSSNSQNESLLNALVSNNGIYQVRAQLNGCYSSYDSTTIVVNPIPSSPLTSNSGPYCEDDTLELFATSTPGATYEWIGPNSFNSNSQNETLLNALVSNNGIYQVRVQLNGCYSSYDSTTIVVNTIPSSPLASNSGPYCENDTLELFATSTLGATYEWIGPNSFSSNSQNETQLNALSTNNGIYQVRVQLNGCYSSYDSTTIIVNPIPSSPLASNSGPYCENDTLDLFATSIAGATYEWIGPNSFSSNSQNETLLNTSVSNNGIYQVRVQLNGCYSSYDSTTIVVNPIPSSPLASNSGPYCENDTLELFATMIAGATYEWIGPNSFSSNSQNVIFLNSSILLNGDYLVRVNVNGCKSQFDSTTLIINALPQVSVADTLIFCEGDTIHLISNSNMNGNYQWTGPLSFTSSEILPEIVNSQITNSGVYYLHIEANGCISNTDSTYVVINELPTIVTNSDTSICLGSTINLIANGGINYSWDNGLGIGNNFVLNPTVNSTYIVTGFDLNNCSNLDTVTISIFSEQSINFSIPDDTVCVSNGLINLSATPSGGQFSGNGVIGNQFNTNLANIGANEISYTIITSDSCQFISTQQIMVVDCAEIETNNSVDISIFPNPANNLISIVSSNIIHSIVLLDIEGRTILEKSIYDTIDELELQNLSNGVYYLLVKFEFGMLTEKIIIQKK